MALTIAILQNSQKGSKSQKNWIQNTAMNGLKLQQMAKRRVGCSINGLWLNPILDLQGPKLSSDN